MFFCTFSFFYFEKKYETLFSPFGFWIFKILNLQKNKTQISKFWTSCTCKTILRMLHTFVTFEIWEKYSLYGLFSFGKKISKEKMQEIFFKRGNIVCWSCFVRSKNDYVCHFKHYNLLIHTVKKFEKITTCSFNSLN